MRGPVRPQRITTLKLMPLLQQRAMAVLACPRDQARLEAADGPSRHGQLRCTQCRRLYPLVDGIASFLELQSGTREAQLMASEIRARDWRYAQELSRQAQIERLPELDAICKLLGRCKGQRVLDAGCGRGAMLPAAHGADLYCGIDFSRQGLLAFPPRPADIGEVALFHGDVCALPFGNGAFDSAFSAQVLEHVPSVQGRSRFIAELARVVKPGARLVLTAYNWHEGRRIKNIPKEGMHPSGVFYHCYDADELRQLLSQFFEVDCIWGGGVALPGTRRLTSALGSWNRYWDRLWWNTRQGLRFGEILMARCHAKS